MHDGKGFAFAFPMGVPARQDSSKLGLMLSFSIKSQKARNPLRSSLCVCVESLVLTFLVDRLVSYGHNWQSSDVSIRYC